MRASGWLCGVGGLFGAALALACRPPPPSGRALGLYAVHGTLEENGCRPGIEPVDPLRFTVELRRDGPTLTWRIPDARPVGGVLRDDGSFRLSTRTDIQAWAADPAQGIAGCTLAQIETVRGVLASVDDGPGMLAEGGVAPDAGPAARGPDGFRAEDEIEIAVAAGDCRALLISNGGSFPSLPCTLRYELLGERVPD